MPKRKELHAFSTFSGKMVTRKDYLSKLGYRDDQRSYGEYTPNYLMEPTSVWNLSKIVPEAKLLVAFRNPVERAFSAYRHAMGVKALRPTETFEDVIDQAMSGSIRPWLHGILSEGLYAAGLRRLFGYFDQDQVLLIDFDQLRDPRRAALLEEELLKFCYLNRQSIESLPNINTASHWSSKASAPTISISKDTQNVLQDYYGASRADLEKIIGYNLSWW
jgi:hypothetical protein